MNNINSRLFKIRGAIKNKGFLKLSIFSLLTIFLLSSCNKKDSNFYDDTDVVNQSDNISEDISNSDEALSKIQDEVKILIGRDDVETTELFNFENTYYIKVKINDFNEIWRYENGDLKRILFNMKDVVYSQDDDKIIFDGANNSYIIKFKSDNEGKGKILYECYYTDILDSDNGDFTCYINDFFSICVVDNKENKIILNKYIDLENEFSNENFKLDNKRFFLPGRMQVNETGWISSSNMAYFACYDMSNVYFIIDIDKKAVFRPNFTTGAGYEDFIDKDNGYIVSGNTNYALDIDSYMMEHMEKQYNYFYLINLYTLEKFEIAKSIKNKFEPKKEDEKTISYIASSGERVKVDLSDMIGKDCAYTKEGIKDTLFSELNINEADNVNLHKFNDIDYAVVDDGKNKMLIQYFENNKVNIIADKLVDINFSELGKYISLYNRCGDFIVLDNSGNKYLEDNMFNYFSNNDTSSNNQEDESDIELGVTLWGKNNDKLYILTKKGDMLSNIFEVNLVDKSIRDLAYDIDCRFENLYIDISEGFVVYSTFPGPIFYSYDKEVNDDVCLYVKYFNSNEKVEIARTKGKSIHFYILDNELNYYCIKNDIQGVYKLTEDGLVNISQEQENLQEQQLSLNGISLTKDIISSVYRGEDKYTYEVLLFALSVNNNENNLYKGYFPFDENTGFLFPLDKSNEVLIQVFGEKEYPSFEDVFDCEEESNTYYKNLDFGWNTGYIADKVTANIIDNKLYTNFELINLWYDVGGDPVPTAIAECEITYCINKSNDKIYLQFKKMKILSKLVN